MSKQHYTKQQLVRGIMADLIADYRCGLERGCKRDEVLNQIRTLFKHRHTVKLCRYGWPMLEGF